MALASLFLVACGSCQSTVRETALPAIAAGSFDGAATDQDGHRLYLADGANNRVDVVDVSTATPRMAGNVALAAQPHGLAVAPDLHRLYVGLTGGTLAVVDTEAMKVAASVSVDPSTADLLDYSPSTHQVYVGTGAGGQVVAVDARTGRVSGRLHTGAPVEQPRYDPVDGMLYVSVPVKEAIFQFDPRRDRITRTYPTGRCQPGGLAINPSRQLALAACGASVVMFNLRTGARDVNQQVGGGDIVTYDATADSFAVATPRGATDSTVSVFDGDGRLIGTVASTPSAHQAAFDDAHGLVYAPAGRGLMSLAPGACLPPPDWLPFAGRMAFFVVPLLAAGLFLWLAGRRRSNRGEPKKATYEELRDEDLALERERMRALEDSLYGPLNPDSPN
jgi:hypothetical protein